MQFGVVKFFNDGRGYGFILGDDGKDYFFHRTHMVDRSLATFVVGKRVSFELIPPIAMDKKPQATAVRLATMECLREGGINALGGSQ